MIYLDTSVALAHLLSEDRRPAPSLWDDIIVSSRLLQFELWARLHARALARSHGDAARLLLARVAFLEMTTEVLARALEPFPIALRTLDALHVASAEYVQRNGQVVSLATYDERMAQAAQSIGLPLLPLP